MKTIELKTLLITKEEKDFIIKYINLYKKRPKDDFNYSDYFINELITINQSVEEIHRGLIKYYGRRKKITKFYLVMFLVYSLKKITRKRIRGINFIYFPGNIQIELY